MVAVKYSSNMVMMSSWWTSLPESTVKLVIDAYNELVLEKVKAGQTVDYLSIATMAGVHDVEILPLGYQYYEIAEKLGLKYNLVQNILSRYEELVKNELQLKNIVVVYGLIKFTPTSSGRVSVKSSSRFGQNGLKVRARVNPYLFSGVSSS